MKPLKWYEAKVTDTYDEQGNKVEYDDILKDDVTKDKKTKTKEDKAKAKKTKDEKVSKPKKKPRKAKLSAMKASKSKAQPISQPIVEITEELIEEEAFPFLVADKRGKASRLYLLNDDIVKIE